MCFFFIIIIPIMTLIKSNKNDLVIWYSTETEIKNILKQNDSVKNHFYFELLNLSPS